MRNLLLTLLLVPTLAWSADFVYEKPLHCGNRQAIIDGLTGDRYTENPLWYGNDALDDSEYVMFINHHTGTWTILQMNATIACVLGAGNKIKLNVSNLGNPT